MIKLNNKNITYVALADTNNSIKAPKEIWYADSVNSVKLVYKRKDALIEGEDYEVYHWLIGDQTAYINVPMNFWQNGLDINIGKIENPTYGQFFIAKENSNDTYGRFSVQIGNNSSNMYLLVGFRDSDTTSTHIADISPYSSVPSEVNMQFYIDDGIAYCMQNGTLKTGLSMSESKWNKDIAILGKLAKASYLREYNKSDNSYIQNLIPVKLLKPVPKWLDANGIRRQVGECGMIDLVSGKFYGNVNSVGTFTVENYYERKEWLVADIPANTRCIDLPINSNVISYSMLISQVGNSTFFETVGNYRYYTAPVNLPSIAVWNIATSSNVNSFNVGLQENELFNITSSESSLIINGVEVQKIGFPVSAVVFRCGGSYGNSITDTSSIFVDGEERYIPCTLTMDLPASMDANNIARTKGTSGMWDLVSDKFYGNVANSGTFKAVNLAEGVDYEVHDWLVANIPIGVTMMTLPINSSTFSYQTVLDEQQANIGHFTTNGYSYVTNNNSMDIVKIYDNVNKQTVSSSNVNSRSMGIESSENSMTINGVNIQQLGFPVKNKLITSASNSLNATTTRTSKIIVNGIERYIPIKLLKSITAKYDANGIARNAGECGMYDTVNDVFYGNVANSGTFSVSD